MAGEYDDGAGFSGPAVFAFVSEVEQCDEPLPEDCVAIHLQNRILLYRTSAPLDSVLSDLLADVIAEHGTLGQEYGIRLIAESQYEVQQIHRPYAARSEYNMLGEIGDSRYYGGPAPKEWLAVV
ncbi:hypothetical protein E4T66_17805 [Sinimarinibacterium sp. CAU 1509]|nr:hypothetical protein E4T66_17805 [Sinimarinibacterium sp. CAU 1509]